MRDCQSKAPAGGSEAQVGITERNHDGVERSIMGSRGERMLNGAMDNARRARPSVTISSCSSTLRVSQGAKGGRFPKLQIGVFVLGVLGWFVNFEYGRISTLDSESFELDLSTYGQELNGRVTEHRAGDTSGSSFVQNL